MIHDARTTKILAQAKQHRADAIGHFMKRHPVYVVFALTLGAVILTIGQNFSTDVATASNQVQVADGGSR